MPPIRTLSAGSLYSLGLLLLLGLLPPQTLHAEVIHFDIVGGINYTTGQDIYGLDGATFSASIYLDTDIIDVQGSGEALTSYSGFYGQFSLGNGHLQSIGEADWLRDLEIANSGSTDQLKFLWDTDDIPDVVTNFYTDSLTLQIVDFSGEGLPDTSINSLLHADYDSLFVGLIRLEILDAQTGAYAYNIEGETIQVSVSSVVPVPAAVWLFGSGLGMLGWIRRRQTA